jgi:uncharacterized BrkB/YihY/UPF0761 family membrane protein
VSDYLNSLLNKVYKNKIARNYMKKRIFVFFILFLLIIGLLIFVEYTYFGGLSGFVVNGMR